MIGILIALTRRIKSARENSMEQATGHYDLNPEEDYFITNKEALSCILQYTRCVRKPKSGIGTFMVRQNLKFIAKEIELLDVLFEYFDTKSKMTENEGQRNKKLVEQSKLVKIKLEEYRNAFVEIREGVIGEYIVNYERCSRTVDFWRTKIEETIQNTTKRPWILNMEVEINLLVNVYDLCRNNHSEAENYVDCVFFEDILRKIIRIDRTLLDNRAYFVHVSMFEIFSKFGI